MLEPTAYPEVTDWLGSEVQHWKGKAREAQAKVAEYENALTWGVSCLGCAKQLDKAIADHERAEQAEATPRLCTALCRDVERERDELTAERERLRTRLDRVIQGRTEARLDRNAQRRRAERAEAERERLRGYLAGWRKAANSVEAVILHRAKEAEAERDRLRSMFYALADQRDALKAAEKRMWDLIARLRAKDEIESDEIADMIQSALDTPSAPENPQDGPGGADSPASGQTPANPATTTTPAPTDAQEG